MPEKACVMGRAVGMLKTAAMPLPSPASPGMRKPAGKSLPPDALLHQAHTAFSSMALTGQPVCSSLRRYPQPGAWRVQGGRRAVAVHAH